MAAEETALSFGRDFYNPWEVERVWGRVVEGLEADAATLPGAIFKQSR